MDAGNPAVRWTAWCMGWCLRTARWSIRAARLGWRVFGGERLLLNIMALTVVVGAGLLLWWTVLQPISPMLSAEVVEPPGGEVEVDRSRQNTFRVTRTICMSRGAWAHVTRYYLGADGEGIEYKLAPRDILFLPAGCHTRSRVMVVPSSLPPGTYRFRAQVEFCNPLRCEDGWAQEIVVRVMGRWPFEGTAPPALLQDPM